MAGLRVVVTGATGNIGSGLVARLAADPAVAAVTGIARRPPRDGSPPGVTWAACDVTRDAGLADVFAGADVIAHLSVLFQPSHRPQRTWSTNVLGTSRVLAAAAAARVPAFVHASSVVAYAPAGPGAGRVAEDHPTHGADPACAYAREKAYAERLLDAFEARNPGVRTVRLRPGLVLSAGSSAHQRRAFGGPFMPSRLPGVLPAAPGVRFQVLHSDDAADAFHLAVTRPVTGAFNLAADPPVDAALLARLTGARTVRVPYAALRAATAAAWRLRLFATSPWLLDAVAALPLMDTGRAHRELGWTPAHSAEDTLTALLAGLRDRAGADTPPLRGRLPGGGRLREILTGTGGRA
ncbi:NAD-dependent epimerase/dehydratase family protein [Streptomyces sp. RFCAC02]|uniref:NAD-dependent epimerase/dehydratase family protein n=1 Tax=Streptomyces sp. RFCAC02 TaxID=2499143 RepID=UPI0019D00772|nr:NAD-dependent epimerase/dehydratase family protein [Streptomyces sp. RFCAC02]